MAPKPVTLTFAGDAAKLERTFEKVGSGAKEMAGDLDSAASQAKSFGGALDKTGQAADGAEGKFAGTADVLDGLGGIMGINTGAATGMMRAWSDLSGGFAAIQPMIGTVTAAMQGGLKSALTMIQTHPVLFTMGLLATAFVTLWMNSETFREVVTDVFKSIQQVIGDVIGWILDGFGKFLGGIAKIAEAASHLPLVGDKFDGIAEKVRNAQRDVEGLADGFHNMGVEADKAAKGGMSGLAGIMDRMGVSPNFIGPLSAGQQYRGARASGGPVAAGGAYLVGERGPELFVPGSAGNVVPNGGGAVYNVHVSAMDPTAAATAVVRAIEEFEARNGPRFARTS